MATILTNIRDPSWWFTVFVLGTFVGVIAGFLKDYLERQYGLIFAWTKARRDAARRSRAEAIAAWSASESLLVIALLQVLFWVVCFIGLATIGIVVICDMRARYGNVNLTTINILPWRQVVAYVAFLVLIIAYGLKTMEIVGRGEQAIKAFRKARSLPHFADKDS
jgi:hypothetical protein